MNMNLDTLREANVKRCEQYFHPLNSWSPTDWACAMAGEAGEACNAVKKLKRHAAGAGVPGQPTTTVECVDAIAKELADTIIYADLLAARLHINLSDAVRHKFNEVSDRMHSPIRI